MTLPTHVPARESLFDILRIAARCGLELLAASLLVMTGVRVVATARSFVSRQQPSGTRRDVACSLAPYGVLRRRMRHALGRLACIRRRGVALPSRNPLSGAPSARTRPDPFRPVRATLCPGLFSTAHAGPLPYIFRARAMGVSGGVRSGDGARRPNRRSGALSVPTTPDRSAYLSRDTFRARAMGVSGGVRSGDGARRPHRRSGAPSVPTTPDRSTYVSRDTFRARAMGVSGGVRSGNGARRPNRRSGAPSVPTTPDRSAYLSRDTLRARAMGLSGGVRSGDGARPAQPRVRSPFRTDNAGPLHIPLARYVSRTRDGAVRSCTVRQWRRPASAGPAATARASRPSRNPLPGAVTALPTPHRSPTRLARNVSRTRDGAVRWCTVRRWPPSTRAGRLCAARPRKPRKRALLP